MKYLLAGLLLTISANLFAEDVIIYRWVSKDNVVHFSQNQPASGNYTEIVMAANGQPKKPTGSVSKAIPEINTEEVKTLVIDTTSQCKEAKENLATLTSFERIRYTDEAGETKILDKAQQEEQLTINKARIKEFCK
jgi:hypothetical protein